MHPIHPKVWPCLYILRRPEYAYGYDIYRPSVNTLWNKNMKIELVLIYQHMFETNTNEAMHHCSVCQTHNISFFVLNISSCMRQGIDPRYQNTSKPAGKPRTLEIHLSLILLVWNSWFIFNSDRVAEEQDPQVRFSVILRTSLLCR